MRSLADDIDVPSKRILYVLNALLVVIAVRIIVTVARRGFDLFTVQDNGSVWVGVLVVAGAAVVSRFLID